MKETVEIEKNQLIKLYEKMCDIEEAIKSQNIGGVGIAFGEMKYHYLEFIMHRMGRLPQGYPQAEKP